MLTHSTAPLTPADQFDRVARSYAAGQARRLPVHEAIALLRPRSTDHALDVATGTGALAWALAQETAVSVGVDVSPGMLGVALAAHPRARRRSVFLLNSAESLAFGDASFEIVTCSRALHHMAGPVQAVREMTRVLRPNGRLLIIDNVTHERPSLAAVHNRLEVMRDPSHARTLPASELQSIVLAAGCRIESFSVKESTRAVDRWLDDAEAQTAARRAVAQAIGQWAQRDGSSWAQHFLHDAHGALAIRLRQAWLLARPIGHRPRGRCSGAPEERSSPSRSWTGDQRLGAMSAGR
jgi:ubiquinone/menaquinone biosynthesis C-methylase UbiE